MSSPTHVSSQTGTRTLTLTLTALILTLALPLPLPLTPAPARAAAAPTTTPATDTSTAARTTAGTAEVAPHFDVDAVVARGGAVGLPGMSTAQVGPSGSLRLGLSGEFFRGSDFLVSAVGSSGDRNTRVRGTVTVAGTPWRHLELFAGLSGAANRNRRICGQGDSSDLCTSESGRADPEVIRSSAAVALGGKLALPLPAGFSLGGELGARLLPSLDGVAFDGDATSGWAQVLAGLDPRESAGVPLRAHLLAGFFLDNSYNLRQVTEETASSRLVSAFAYGMGRERLQSALGVDAPWRTPWAGLLVRPSLEYHVDLVTAEADPAFEAAAAAGAGGRDNRDQHWLTGGLTVQGRRGLAVGASIDLAVRSTGFAHGPRLPTWNAVLALSQALDLSTPKLITRIVERPVERPPSEGEIAGRVVDGSGRPVDGALVAVAGRPQSRVATDPDGSFRARGLPPGELALEVRARGFDVTRLGAAVTAGRATAVTVSLQPRLLPVSGRLADPAGAGVPATVKIQGANLIEVPVEPTGTFSALLPAGRHRVRVDAPSFLSKLVTLEIPEAGASGEGPATVPLRLELTLRPRPAVPRFTFSEGVGRFAAPVVFAAAELSTEAQALLDELVDALLAQQPEPARLRIEGHWDASLAEEEAQRLTEAQARAVVAYLVKNGIEESRLEPAGLGRSRPLPGQPRSRQRRIEVHPLP